MSCGLAAGRLTYLLSRRRAGWRISRSLAKNGTYGRTVTYYDSFSIRHMLAYHYNKNRHRSCAECFKSRHDRVISREPECGRKMPQDGGFVPEANTRYALFMVCHCAERFYHMIKVFLRIDAAGDRKAQQFRMSSSRLPGVWIASLHN